MVQAYEVEGSGAGVWLLLTPQEFEIIFARFLRGMEAEDLRDDEIVRVMRGMRWIEKVVASAKATATEVKEGLRPEEGATALEEGQAVAEGARHPEKVE